MGVEQGADEETHSTAKIDVFKVGFVREAPVVVVSRRVRPSSRTVAARGVLCEVKDRARVVLIAYLGSETLEQEQPLAARVRVAFLASEHQSCMLRPYR